jgi:hypothetical protein
MNYIELTTQLLQETAGAYQLSDSALTDEICTMIKRYSKGNITQVQINNKWQIHARIHQHVNKFLQKKLYKHKSIWIRLVYMIVVDISI